MLRRDGLGRRELTTRQVRPFHCLEFSGSNSGIKMVANLGIVDLAHASPESIPEQGPLIDNGLSLEVFVARKSQRFPDPID